MQREQEKANAQQHQPQQQQSQQQQQPQHTNKVAEKPDKSKVPDVWPDDVEVAFWEGESWLRRKKPVCADY